MAGLLPEYKMDQSQGLRESINNMVLNQAQMSVDPNEAVARGQLNVEKPVEFNYGKDAVNQAILNKVRNTMYNPKNFEDLQKLDYIKNRSRALDRAKGSIMGQVNLDKQKESMERQRAAAEDAQRASILGSVLGLAGTAAGMYFAGPAGAVLGGGMASQAQTREPWRG